MSLIVGAGVLYGCGVDFGYLLPAIGGQADILRQSVPFEQALASDLLSAEQKGKLMLIRDAREFAEINIGLHTANTYETFYDAQDQPVAFNLSASRRDALAPMTWTFPFVGTVPFLGYFERDLAESMKQRLQADGLDVFIYEIDAYNTGSALPNPILSPMLARDEESLVEVVIHELLHNTIWRPNDAEFNESLATYVGRKGTQLYYQDRFPSTPDRWQQVADRYDDEDHFIQFAFELLTDLEVFYSSLLSSEEKIAGREIIVGSALQKFADEVQPLLHDPQRYAWVQDIPANNAFLLGLQRYHSGLDLFEEVFQAAGGDWGRALAVFADAAAGEDDAFEYLRIWLQSPASQRARQPLSTPPQGPAERAACPLSRKRTLLHAEVPLQQ